MSVDRDERRVPVYGQPTETFTQNNNCTIDIKSVPLRQYEMLFSHRVYQENRAMLETLEVSAKSKYKPLEHLPHSYFHQKPWLKGRIIPCLKVNRSLEMYFIMRDRAQIWNKLPNLEVYCWHRWQTDWLTDGLTVSWPQQGRASHFRETPTLIKGSCEPTREWNGKK